MGSSELEKLQEAIIPVEKRERLSILQGRLERLVELLSDIKIDPNADISAVITDIIEIVDEIIEKSDAIIGSENENKSPLTRLIERFDKPDTASSDALELLKRIRIEFLKNPEEFNTKDGEFANLVRGLVPYLLIAVKNDISYLLRSK